jgi:SNF2 family DNA or RNA helicase
MGAAATSSRSSLTSELHALIRPFMLRRHTPRRAVMLAHRTSQRRGVAGRLKENVDLGLPPKREVVLYTGLSKMQKQLYRVILTKNSSALGAANSRALVSTLRHPLAWADAATRR